MSDLASLFTIAGAILAAGIFAAALLIARARKRNQHPRDDFMFRKDHWGM